MTFRQLLCVTVLALSVAKPVVAQTVTITPTPTFPPTQLQSGATPYMPYPQQSGITYFGTSALNGGITSIQPNPLAEARPVKSSTFSQGGTSTIPGGDTASQSTNATDSTNVTGGRGLSNRGR